MNAPALNTHEPDRRAAKTLTPHLRAIALGIAILLAVLFGVRAATAPRSVVPAYRTVKLDHGPLAAKVTANGTLSALVTVSVGSQVSGRIESLGADYGSYVKKGQVVASIEPSLFRASAAQANANHHAMLAVVERAEAQIVNAQRQFERARPGRAQSSLHDDRLAHRRHRDLAQRGCRPNRGGDPASANPASSGACASSETMPKRSAI